VTLASGRGMPNVATRRSRAVRAAVGNLAHEGTATDDSHGVRVRQEGKSCLGECVVEGLDGWKGYYGEHKRVYISFPHPPLEKGIEGNFARRSQIPPPPLC
jgi:hypothetical protein